MIKIIALAALVLFSAPSVARAGDAAYYDLTKVATECAACKAEAKAVAADVKAWQAEVDKLEAAAKHQLAQQQISKYQTEVNKREADSRAKTQARVLAILPAIAKARRLAAIIPVAGAFYAAPAVNLTDEIVRRLDAGEGRGDDELRAENEKLRAENAKLKAKPEASAKAVGPAK